MVAPPDLSPASPCADPPSLDIFPWLKALPLAPEYYPTLAEFQDPISYILKIEKEASSYGICKIIPPVSAPPRKTTLANLRRSFSSPGKKAPSFTTRQQQIGFCPRRPRPAQKSVRQSGESYTLEKFEAKSKQFERTQMKKLGKGGSLAPIEVETLFWKASADKPLLVEYGNDMPGSGFQEHQGGLVEEEGGDVGDSAWNMRVVSRVSGSLLRFMREDVPGVTSPMVYVGMMFSWFAWHVEDHELHSLNYHHMGAGKAWYGVPRDARLSFEDVVRVQGYRGEVNPLVTFAILGEKTTVMSPEVLLGAGIPCCRLVQNPGEFVVTFPGAYHSGFSLGFNCAEATNIATPEWLKVAKEAAVRRASINFPPMLSHIQLLYELALSLHSRVSLKRNPELRSSRLKDKKRGEGEIMLKKQFIESVIQSNNQISTLLGKGSFCVILPINMPNTSLTPSSHSRTQGEVKPISSLGLRYLKKAEDARKDGSMPECQPNGPSNIYCSKAQIVGCEERNEQQDSILYDQGLLPCVTCGVLGFACMVVVQPSEAASAYLMSADSSSFSGKENNDNPAVTIPMLGDISGHVRREDGDLYNRSLELSVNHLKPYNASNMASEVAVPCGTSALDLLTAAYGEDLSDFEESPKMLNMPDPVENFPSPNSSLQLESGNLVTECSIMYPNDEEIKRSFGLHDPFFSLNSHCTSQFDTVNSFGKCIIPINYSVPFIQKPDEDSSRMHLFCLEHALEVERQLHAIGGANVMILCHPDFSKIEAKAKSSAEEFGLNYPWKVIPFKEACKEDKERIQSVLADEEVVPVASDWSVKMGMNLYYSANLNKFPLYSKQMAYNIVIYKAFGRDASGNSPGKPRARRREHGKQKKIVVGKWCGKVWMSNQVHPYLTNPEEEEEEEDEEDEDANEEEYKLEVCKLVSSDDHVPEPVMPMNSSEPSKTVSEQPSRKRKRTKKKMSAKMLKYDESVAGKNIDDSCEETSQQCGRSLQNKRKKGTRSHAEDKLNETEDEISHLNDNGKLHLQTKRRQAKPDKPKLIKNAYKFDEVEALKSVDTSDLPGASGITEVSEVPEVAKKIRKKPHNRKGKKDLGKQMVTDDDEDGEFPCDFEGCTMTFSTRQHLSLHKRNICHVDGCNKTLFSHRYLLHHHRVHLDDRPLKCLVKGCNRAFKWAWARTEHMRVHTGSRPYICSEPGCDQTFRFVSDASRHKRKTGHVTYKNKG